MFDSNNAIFNDQCVACKSKKGKHLKKKLVTFQNFNLIDDANKQRF